jgi:cytochrome c oxidase subunit 2
MMPRAVGRPPSIRSRRRLQAVALIAGLALVLLFGLAPSAFADALTPESGGSPNADRIDTLYKLTLYIAVVVFVGVEGTLIYSLVRFKARKGATPAQIHGNTRLEIGWTLGAASILVVLATVTFVELNGIKNPPASGPGGLATASGAQFASVDQPQPPGGKALNIDVEGRQFLWRYTYPNGAYAFETMVVPVNTTVTLDLRATDVAHSWWIPKLGGKFDAIPGYTNKTWFKIPREGVFYGQCAELCGRGHADMIAHVRAVSVTAYQAWVADQKRYIDEANKAAAAERARLEKLSNSPTQSP